MKNAIVTDMRYCMSLAPLRSLARAGYRVTGTELDSVPEQEALGFYSKYLSEKRVLSSKDPVSDLMALCRELDRPVVLPVGRAMMELFIENEELQNVSQTLLPTAEAMELVDDKFTIWKLAELYGIPTPRTASLSMSKTLDALAEEVRYPAFIKYRNGELLGLKPVDRYTIVKSPEELKAKYPLMNSRDYDPIVQEYVPGHDLGIAVVMGPYGRLLDHICYESLREYPSSGGPTCLCRTIESPKMVRYAERLLGEIGYAGLAMLDFRGTADEPLLLEVNPRVWGSANLCDVAESTLFRSWAQASAFEPVGPVGYRVGATMRFYPHYLAYTLSEIKHGAGIVPTLREHFKYRTAVEGVKLDDPAPYRRYVKNLIKRSISK